MSKVELTNMCMIYDKANDKVLVQNRRLPMFLEKKYSEGFGIWNEESISELKWL